MYYQFTVRFLVLFSLLSSCQFSQTQTENQILRLGCEKFDDYMPILENRKVGLLVNHTTKLGNIHFIDTLISRGVDVSKVFAPEHGFRGTADAGEHIGSGIDAKTGLPVVSLYGQNKKPSSDDLEGVDVIIFDIQDVGVRFYTYISSMHYMMEACAENEIPMVVLDRPNPNGDYFDGPVLDLEYQSFVGMHPIPVVHGLTVGELAQMINEEGWLADSLVCDLTIVTMDNYKHAMPYSLPVKPSPNLPNDLSIRLYPSLCFFEATNISVGRGTYMPFQIIGYPDAKYGDFSFTPKSIDGMSKYPLQQDQLCYGLDLRNESIDHKFSLTYFLLFYKKSGFEQDFVNRKRWFNLLAGNASLLEQIKNGLGEEEIRLSWEDELREYSQLRSKYLLYP